MHWTDAAYFGTPAYGWWQEAPGAVPKLRFPDHLTLARCLQALLDPYDLAHLFDRNAISYLKKDAGKILSDPSDPRWPMLQFCMLLWDGYGTEAWVFLLARAPELCTAELRELIEILLPKDARAPNERAIDNWIREAYEQRELGKARGGA